MQDRIYLLDYSELREAVDAQILMQQALEKLDAQRRQKAMRARDSSARASCVGAGLLLQKAVAEQNLSSAFFRYFKVRDLIASLEHPRDLHLVFGPNGKPEFADRAFRFSLSHSGDYALCAVSDRPVGADIERIRTRNMRAGERYFAASERERLAACATEEERQDLFHCLWTRKEAFGKMLGVGVLAVLDRDPSVENELNWLEFPIPEGYAACVCQCSETARFLQKQE